MDRGTLSQVALQDGAQNEKCSDSAEPAAQVNKEEQTQAQSASTGRVGIRQVVIFIFKSSTSSHLAALLLLAAAFRGPLLRFESSFLPLLAALSLVIVAIRFR